MSNALLTYRGKEYILVPRKEYERLTASQEDRRHAAKAAKALARFRAGKSKAVPLAQVKRELGF